MTALFDRRVVVKVAPPPPDYVSLQRAVEVSDLRVQFRVSQDLEREANTAEVQITNASPDTRALFQVKGSRLSLAAGYQNAIDVLFVGDVLMSVTGRDGPDWTTSIQVGDGVRLTKYTRMNTSYAGGTDAKRIIMDAGKKLRANEISLVDAVASVTKQFTAGFVANGKASTVLSRLCDATGLEWSVQNGQVQVLKRDTPNKAPITRLSPETGLIGEIEPGTKDQISKRGRVLVVKSLLQPSIRPGARVQIEARGISALFRAFKVTHEGDTHGGAWYTTAEVSEVKP